MVLSIYLIVREKYWKLQAMVLIWVAVIHNYNIRVVKNAITKTYLHEYMKLVAIELFMSIIININFYTECQLFFSVIDVQ